MKNQPLLERFEEKIDKNGPNGCWLWTSARTDRYGVFWYNGKNIFAHRLAYLFYCNDIPEGWFVCHTCDNGFCVRPGHLFVGTAKDNMQDMLKKGRGRRQDGEWNPQAKLTHRDIQKIKELRASGMFHHDIAAEFCVRRETIGKILRGERWNQPEVSYSNL